MFPGYKEAKRYPRELCKDTLQGSRGEILVCSWYFTLSSEDDIGISEGLKRSAAAGGKLFSTSGRVGEACTGAVEVLFIQGINTEYATKHNLS